MRYFFGCLIFSAWIPLAAFAQNAPPAGNAHADELVARLLAMPGVDQDPQGRMNPQRWELIRQIGALGDSAIPALQSARSRAKTSLQRSEITEALADIQTPAATNALIPLATDPDDDVRTAAIIGLYKHDGLPESQGGSDQILPLLARIAASEKIEISRIYICNAMRATLKPIPPATTPDARRIALAIATLRDRLKNDSSDDVRFHAACILTEFGDFSGREELKQYTLALKARGDNSALWGLDQLVPAVERVSGKTFGPVPMNPALSSSTTNVPILKAKRQALLDQIADWARNDPTSPSATAPSPN